MGAPLTAGRFESSCDYSRSEAAKHCMWGETMHHSNFQHVFFQQRFYILIKKEHRINTPQRRSIEGGGVGNQEKEQPLVVLAAAWYESKAHTLNSHTK